MVDDWLALLDERECERRGDECANRVLHEGVRQAAR